jgi:hypothetical protein
MRPPRAPRHVLEPSTRRSSSVGSAASSARTVASGGALAARIRPSATVTSSIARQRAQLADAQCRPRHDGAGGQLRGQVRRAATGDHGPLGGQHHDAVGDRGRLLEAEERLDRASIDLDWRTPVEAIEHHPVFEYATWPLVDDPECSSSRVALIRMKRANGRAVDRQAVLFLEDPDSHNERKHALDVESLEQSEDTHELHPDVLAHARLLCVCR